MRASCALPTFITPVMINGKILADGGLINPVPVEPTAAIPSDLTIAVSLSGRPNTIPAVSAADAGTGVPDDSPQSLSERLRRGVSGLIDVGLFWREEERQAEPEDPALTTESTLDSAEAEVEASSRDAADAQEEEPEQTRKGTAPLYEMGDLPPDLNTMGVVNMSLETMQSMIERFRAAASPVNIKIEIPAAVSGTLDFHKAPEVIEVGRQMAIDAFDEAGI